MSLPRTKPLRELRKEVQATLDRIDAMILAEEQEEHDRPLLPELPPNAPRTDLAAQFRARNNRNQETTP